MLKAVFIALAPIWLVITLILATPMFFDGNWAMALGMILSAAPLALFLGYILIFKSLARTSKDLYAVQMSSLLGVILCLILYFYQASITIQPTLFSVISYLLTLFYIYWYSENGRLSSQVLSTGSSLPDFTISDSDGNLITAAELRKKPTIMMFTRGNWCPLCMAQIDEVAAAYQDLEKLGVQVAIIASQAEKNTQVLAARYAVPILFLIDKDQRLGKQLGLIHHHGLPFGFQVLGHPNDQYYPTVIATDNNGKIIYSDQTSNYRLRPEPEELISLYT